VLCFVALLAGAHAASGIDIDPVSIAAAERNAALNDLSARTRFALPGAFTGQPFDVVVANLEAPTQLACASEVARWAVNAQRLILTGFLGSRVDEICAAYGPGFRVAHAAHEEDWALLELEPLP
jgi:ribosomal protein L11 methyltransferase